MPWSDDPVFYRWDKNGAFLRESKAGIFVPTVENRLPRVYRQSNRMLEGGRGGDGLARVAQEVVRRFVEDRFAL